MRFLIYSLLAISPLPFASARPAWQWFWVLFVGVLAVTTFTRIARSGERQWPPAVTWPVVLIGLFVLWSLVQALVPFSAPSQLGISAVDTVLRARQITSVNPKLTLGNSIFFLSHLLFFLCVFACCSRRDYAVKLIRFVGITITVYAAYGFVVYIAGNEWVLWYKKWASHGALTSSFVNRNNFATYAGLGLMSLIAYAIYWAQDELAEGCKGREFLRHVLETMIVRAWWLPLAIFVTTSALLLTHSKAGFGSVAIAVFLLLVTSPNRFGAETSRIKLITSGAVVAVLAISLFSLSGDILGTRLQRDATLDFRFLAYPYTLDAIADNPVFGFGLGTFDEVYRYYRGEDVTLYFDRAHNDYIEIAFTAGIPAALVLLTAWLVIFTCFVTHLKYGVQYRSFIALGLAVMVQLGLHSLVDFSLQMPAVSYTWVALIAASLAISIRSKRSATAR